MVMDRDNKNFNDVADEVNDNKSDNHKEVEIDIKERDEKAAPAKSKNAVKKKLEQLEKQYAALENEKDELQERLLRKAAEFDNYKKRTENEFSQLIINANAELIRDLLPIFDDLERSVAAHQQGVDSENLKQGVELIYKNFLKVLEKYNVKPIEAVGQEFDPEKHDALMQIESEKYPSGTVVDEHLKGYMMNDRVLRHSQVLVSK